MSTKIMSFLYLVRKNYGLRMDQFELNGSFAVYCWLEKHICMEMRDKGALKQFIHLQFICFAVSTWNKLKLSKEERYTVGTNRHESTGFNPNITMRLYKSVIFATN